MKPVVKILSMSLLMAVLLQFGACGSSSSEEKADQTVGCPHCVTDLGASDGVSQLDQSNDLTPFETTLPDLSPQPDLADSQSGDQTLDSAGDTADSKLQDQQTVDLAEVQQPDLLADMEPDSSAPDDVEPDNSAPDLGQADQAQTPDQNTQPDSAADVGAGKTVTIRVHFDTKPGNSIALRGTGPGLDWVNNKACDWSAGNAWICTVENVSGSFEFKPLFVKGDGTATYALGGNWISDGQSTLDIYPFFEPTAGTVVSHTINTLVLGGTRKIWVYLPPSFNRANVTPKKYPLLIMQDGNNVFVANPNPVKGGWKLEPSLDALIVNGFIGSTEVGVIREMIIVAPENSPSRTWEYTPTDDSGGGGADNYLNFVETEVKPFIETQYPGRIEAGKLGIAGSSLGGLVSLYACWSRPDSFDRCGVISPSLWWDSGWMVGQVKAHTTPKKPLRIYLDNGSLEVGASDTVALYQELLNRQSGAYIDGDDLACIIGQDDGHNEDAWRGRTPWGLHFLYRDPRRVQVTPWPLTAKYPNCAKN